MNKILFYLLISLPILALGQENYCGTQLSEEEKAWLKDWQQNEMQTSIARRSETIYVPLKIHIVGNDEGVGYLQLNTLLQDICDLNEQFFETGFHFYIYGDINYIDNSDFYQHDWIDGYYMMEENNVDDLVNMYFVDDPAGNCGYYSPSGNAMAIANSCASVGNSTIAHELGHFFSLPHTFVGWEGGEPSISNQEQVDGDNCNTAADGFCDTPPDYAAYRWNCSGPPTFTDPDGTEFQPDGTFYMSYSNDACTDKFSVEQQGAMQANISGPRNELLDYPPLEVTDVDSTTLLEPEDNAEDIYSNYAMLKWAAVENAAAYQVSIALNIGFTAISKSIYTTDTFALVTTLSAEKNYFWRVKVIGEGNTCEGYSDYMKFSTGAETFTPTSIELDGKDNNILVFPIPMEQGNTFTIQFPNQGDKMWDLQIFDMTGSQVLYRTVNFSAGQVQTQMPNMPNGMYMLRLSSEGLTYTTPIQIQ